MNEINDLKELRYRTIDADRTLMARLRHYVYFLRETGLKKTIKKTYIKARFGDRIPYSFYRKEVAASASKLRRQRRDGVPGGPMFHVFVFTVNVLEVDLSTQTYTDYHVTTLRPGESAEMQPDEWALFLRGGDKLEPDALYRIAKAVADDPTVDMVYTDEDYNYSVPIYKGDFNPAMICRKNYIGNLLAVFCSALPEDEVEYDDLGSFDLVLKITERAKKILHIPAVLYHNMDPKLVVPKRPKPDPDSILSDITLDYYEVADKLTADAETDMAAISGHIKRLGLSAEVKKTDRAGIYDVNIIPKDHPMVSFMIPNYEQKEVLKNCIDSLIDNLTYDNYEIIVIENNSKSDEIFAYYKEIEKDPHIKVLYYEEGYNFSRINNYAAARAQGEYLVLLNNDTKLISPDLLERMLGFFEQPDVGAVGAKLYYPDGSLQHIGVILGLGGVAGHIACREPGDSRGYLDRAIVSADVSAVTAACMMVKKSLYDELGGLNEDLQVAYNDMDFCARIGRAGYRVIYCAEAEMMHYESISRGFEDRPDKLSRYAGEYNYMRRTWGDVLSADPYYNPNLTDKLSNCNLKDLPEA